MEEQVLHDHLISKGCTEHEIIIATKIARAIDEMDLVVKFAFAIVVKIQWWH